MMNNKYFINHVVHIPYEKLRQKLNMVIPFLLCFENDDDKEVQEILNKVNDFCGEYYYTLCYCVNWKKFSYRKSRWKVNKHSVILLGGSNKRESVDDKVINNIENLFKKLNNNISRSLQNMKALLKIRNNIIESNPNVPIRRKKFDTDDINFNPQDEFGDESLRCRTTPPSNQEAYNLTKLEIEINKQEETQDISYQYIYFGRNTTLHTPSQEFQSHLQQQIPQPTTRNPPIKPVPLYAHQQAAIHNRPQRLITPIFPGFMGPTPQYNLLMHNAPQFYQQQTASVPLIAQTRSLQRSTSSRSHVPASATQSRDETRKRQYSSQNLSEQQTINVDSISSSSDESESRFESPRSKNQRLSSRSSEVTISNITQLSHQPETKLNMFTKSSQQKTIHYRPQERTHPEPSPSQIPSHTYFPRIPRHETSTPQSNEFYDLAGLSGVSQSSNTQQSPTRPLINTSFGYLPLNSLSNIAYPPLSSKSTHRPQTPSSFSIDGILGYTNRPVSPTLNTGHGIVVQRSVGQGTTSSSRSSRPRSRSTPSPNILTGVNNRLQSSSTVVTQRNTGQHRGHTSFNPKKHRMQMYLMPQTAQQHETQTTKSSQLPPVESSQISTGHHNITQRRRRNRSRNRSRSRSSSSERRPPSRS